MESLQDFEVGSGRLEAAAEEQVVVGRYEWVLAHRYKAELNPPQLTRKADDCPANLTAKVPVHAGQRQTDDWLVDVHTRPLQELGRALVPYAYPVSVGEQSAGKAVTHRWHVALDAYAGNDEPPTRQPG